MKINIDSTHDYRLYITKEVNKHKLSSAMTEATIDLLMTSFVDGIAYNQLNLKVEVDG